MSPQGGERGVDDPPQPAARAGEDQRLAGDVLEGDRASPDEAVVDGNDDGDALAEERVDLEVDDTGRRRPQDAEVVVATEDTAHHLGRSALLEGEAHRRIALEEAGEALGEPAGSDRVQEGDADPSALGGDGALGLGDGIAQVVEDALGAPDEGGALPESAGCCGPIRSKSRTLTSCSRRAIFRGDC